MRLIDADDLISREAAKAAIRKKFSTLVDRVEINIVLNGLPAVDAVPVVHGRWIDYKDEHQCSVCKETTIVDFYVWKNIQFDFCPYCGAKMDGKRRGADEAD